MLKNVVAALLTAIAMGGLSAPVLAVPIDELSIGSTSLSLSTSSLDFFSAGGTGEFDVGSSSTGAYSGLGSSNATIQNLSVVTTGAVLVPNFLTIASLPNAQFTLTFIAPGIFGSAECASPPATGQQCTPPGSPFNLTNTPTGTTATFSAFGTVLDTTTGAQNPFTATFSTEVSGKPYQEVLTQLAGGEQIQAPYSASLNVASGNFAGTLAVGQPSLSLSSSAVMFSATTVGPSSSGGFAALNGSAATIQNLSVTAGLVSVPNFLVIPGDPELSFDLNSIDQGIFSSAGCTVAPAIGQTCTPPSSDLNFMNVNAGSTLFLSVQGMATNTATFQQAPFDATFSTQFDIPYQTVLADIVNGQVLDASYSVEFAAGPFAGSVASVPEPPTLALVLSPLLLLFGLNLIRRHQHGDKPL